MNDTLQNGAWAVYHTQQMVTLRCIINRRIAARVCIIHCSVARISFYKTPRCQMHHGMVTQ